VVDDGSHRKTCAFHSIRILSEDARFSAERFRIGLSLAKEPTVLHPGTFREFCSGEQRVCRRGGRLGIGRMFKMKSQIGFDQDS
jgi:hypothetical protein